MITIAIPSLGLRPEYLSQTICSVRSQSVPCKLVVATTSEHVERFVGLDIDDVVLCDRPGIGAAVNAAWSAHPSELVGWIGDDDLLLPESLARAAAYLQNHSASAVFGNCVVIDELGDILRVMRPTRFALQMARVGPNVVPQPGALFRFSMVERVGLLDEKLRYSMDLDLWLKLLPLGVGYIPRTLAAFRHHPGSLTVLKSDPLAETREVQHRHLGRIGRKLHVHGYRLSIFAGKVIGKYFAGLAYLPTEPNTERALTAHRAEGRI